MQIPYIFLLYCSWCIQGALTIYSSIQPHYQPCGPWSYISMQGWVRNRIIIRPGVRIAGRGTLRMTGRRSTITRILQFLARDQWKLIPCGKKNEISTVSIVLLSFFFSARRLSVMSFVPDVPPWRNKGVLHELIKRLKISLTQLDLAIGYQKQFIAIESRSDDLQCFQDSVFFHLRAHRQGRIMKYRKIHKTHIKHR